MQYTRLRYKIPEAIHTNQELDPRGTTHEPEICEGQGFKFFSGSHATEGAPSDNEDTQTTTYHFCRRTVCGDVGELPSVRGMLGLPLASKDSNMPTRLPPVDNVYSIIQHGSQQPMAKRTWRASTRVSCAFPSDVWLRITLRIKLYRLSTLC